MFEARQELAGANRENYGTFKGWVLSGATRVGVTLDDIQPKLNRALVELDTELIYISSVDENSGVATCPAWFRQQNGTPANDAFAVDSRVVINPVWPTYQLAKKITQGIGALYPALYQVKETNLASSATNGNYLLPSDVDGILRVTLEGTGPGQVQMPISRFSLDTISSDGFKYLRTAPGGAPGTLRVTYRAKPVVPDPSDLAATWASTGLPDTAADLPVLYAVLASLPTADASKTQTNSVEQSDRNRLVQGGSANSTSRRLQEIYQARLLDERRKLTDRYPARLFKELNG